MVSDSSQMMTGLTAVARHVTNSMRTAATAGSQCSAMVTARQRAAGALMHYRRVLAHLSTSYAGGERNARGALVESATLALHPLAQ